MVGRNMLLRAVALCAVGWFAGAMHAASITVLNPSFETPSGATPFGVSTAIDNWTTYGDQPFDTGGGAKSSGSGVFPNKNPDNSLNFTNADQNQVAYVFTKSSIAANRDGLEQILSSNYAANKAYTFSLLVGLAGTAPDATDPFTMALFYYDPANPSARPIVASKTIFNDGPTGLSKTTLIPITLTSSILSAGDPAVGASPKQIGVEIFTALGSDATATAGGQYVFDLAQVNEVPEPGALTAIGGGAMLLLARLRRPRRMERK